MEPFLKDISDFPSHYIILRVQIHRCPTSSTFTRVNSFAGGQHFLASLFSGVPSVMTMRAYKF